MNDDERKAALQAELHAADAAMNDPMLDMMLAEQRWREAPSIDTHAAYVAALRGYLDADVAGQATMLRAVDLATELAGVDSEAVHRIEGQAAKLSQVVNLMRARLEHIERADPLSPHPPDR